MQPGLQGASGPVDYSVLNRAVSEASDSALLDFPDLDELELEALDVGGLDDAVLGVPMPSFPQPDMLGHQQGSAGAMSHSSAGRDAHALGSFAVQQQQQLEDQFFVLSADSPSAIGLVGVPPAAADVTPAAAAAAWTGYNQITDQQQLQCVQPQYYGPQWLAPLQQQQGGYLVASAGLAAAVGSGYAFPPACTPATWPAAESLAGASAQQQQERQSALWLQMQLAPTTISGTLRFPSIAAQTLQPSAFTAVNHPITLQTFTHQPPPRLLDEHATQVLSIGPAAAAAALEAEVQGFNGVNRFDTALKTINQGGTHAAAAAGGGGTPAAAAAPESSAPLVPHSQGVVADGEQCYDGVEEYTRKADLALAEAKVSKDNLRLNGRGRDKWKNTYRAPLMYLRIIIKALLLLFTDPELQAIIDKEPAKESDNKDRCYQVLEHVIGGLRPAKEPKNPRAKLFPQKDEKNRAGVVYYLGRLVSFGVGEFISPLMLNSWFKKDTGSGYELDYEKMKADTNLVCVKAKLGNGRGFTRSWILPIDLNQIAGMALETPERPTIEKPRASAGEADRAEYFAWYRENRREEPLAAINSTEAADESETESLDLPVAASADPPQLRRISIKRTGAQQAVHQATTAAAAAGANDVHVGGAAAEQGTLLEQVRQDAFAAARQPRSKRQRALPSRLRDCQLL